MPRLLVRDRTASRKLYKGSVAEEVLVAEQNRIEAERAEAHRWSEAAAHDAGEVKQTPNEALKLLKDPHIAYKRATPHVRRLLNQALFDALLIRDEDVAGAKTRALGRRDPPPRRIVPEPSGGPPERPRPPFGGRGFQ